MALVTIATDASFDTGTASRAPHIAGDMVAGEALLACAPCYIRASDGKVLMTNATAADEKARLAGFTPRAVAIGNPVDLFGLGTRMRYAAGLTPGAIYYLAATAGRLDTAATIGDAVGVVQAVSDTDIRVTRAI